MEAIKLIIKNQKGFLSRLYGVEVYILIGDYSNAFLSRLYGVEVIEGELPQIDTFLSRLYGVEECSIKRRR